MQEISKYLARSFVHTLFAKLEDQTSQGHESNELVTIFRAACHGFWIRGFRSTRVGPLRCLCNDATLLPYSGSALRGFLRDAGAGISLWLVLSGAAVLWRSVVIGVGLCFQLQTHLLRNFKAEEIAE